MNDNKKVLITGAGRGIGLAILKQFARNENELYVCELQKTDEFIEQFEIIEKENNVKIHPYFFDLGDEEACKTNIKQIIRDSGGIDICINNAGVAIPRFFMMTPESELRKAMEINFIRPFQIIQMVSRGMIKNKKGVIINIASVSGVMNEKGGIAYGTSKAALIFATRTMAMELGEHNIRVNSVSPGFINTDMWRNRKEEIIEQVLASTPLHRQGQPEEVAALVAFLASDQAQHITGQNYIIDGGGRGL